MHPHQDVDRTVAPHLSASEVIEQRITFADVLLRRAEDDHDGLLFEDSHWSWREVVDECRRRAALLLDLRREGEPFHVGVLLENVPDYIFMIGAAALSGATVVGINPTRRGAELASDIRGVDCSVIVTDAAGSALLEGLDTGVESSRVLRVDVTEWEDRLATYPIESFVLPPAAEDPSTCLLLTFTSGSTGAPKAVICSSGRLAVIACTNVLDLVPDDVSYNAMPLFHGNAIMACWAPSVFVGATFTMRRKFSVSGFLPDVLRFGVTFFNYVGRSLAYLLSAPESPDEARTRLRVVFGTEAAPLDRAEFARRFGVHPTESYGSSEGAVVISVTPDTPPGALGRPPETMPQVEVLGPDGAPCPRARFDEHGQLLNPHEAIGEIVNLAGAMMFEGYYNNPAATAERVDGPVFRTGDLGYRDEAGFFYFAGRSADRLRVDSENFAAAPVERILARFPAVALVAVYPVPDPRTGDQVMAAVQLRDGARFDAKEFGAFLEAQPDLGTKWAPRFVRIVGEMPVTATRKVDKPSLVAASWLTDDPLFVSLDGSLHYVPATAEHRGQLLAEYERYGRAPAIARG
ncbi:MAG TPA: AMP-binding protein [Marmoricola sp.]|nr:AMP-binding protein [Marmoricola sp.]